MSRDPRAGGRHARRPWRQPLPDQVEEVLGRIRELMPHYRLVVARDGTLDEIEVQTEVARTSHDEVELTARISRAIEDALGCTMAVTLMAPGTVPRSEGGKLPRVVDRRQFT
jgi:phenylacetate-CoA ligase